MSQAHVLALLVQEIRAARSLLLFLLVMPEKGCVANCRGLKGTEDPNFKGRMGLECVLETELQHAFAPVAVGFLYHSSNLLCSAHWFKWIFFIL